MKFNKTLSQSNFSDQKEHLIRMKDRESIVGIFRGEPYEYYALFNGKFYEEVAKGTPKSALRFRINFVIKDGTSYTAKIFESNKTVYGQLADLNEEYDLEKTIVKITRNGSGTDTIYSIIPTPKQSLSKETMNYLDKMQLHNLEKEKQEAPLNPAQAWADEDPSFDEPEF